VYNKQVRWYIKRPFNGIFTQQYLYQNYWNRTTIVEIILGGWMVSFFETYCSAQLEGTAYHSPKLHPGSCSSVGMQQGTDRHTDRHTDGRGHSTFCLGYASCEMQ